MQQSLRPWAGPGPSGGRRSGRQVSSRISTTGRPAHGASTAAASASAAAATRTFALASSRSSRRRRLAGHAAPGTAAATRPLWQWPATATAQLNNASARTWCPCSTPPTRSFTAAHHGRTMSTTPTAILLESV